MTKNEVQSTAEQRWSGGAGIRPRHNLQPRAIYTPVTHITCLAGDRELRSNSNSWLSFEVPTRCGGYRVVLETAARKAIGLDEGATRTLQFCCLCKPFGSGFVEVHKSLILLNRMLQMKAISYVKIWVRLTHRSSAYRQQKRSKWTRSNGGFSRQHTRLLRTVTTSILLVKLLLKFDSRNYHGRGEEHTDISARGQLHT